MANVNKHAPQVVALLTETRAWLADPEHWVQGTNGVQATGEPAHDAFKKSLESASKTCLWGGVARAFHRMFDPSAMLDASDWSLTRVQPQRGEKRSPMKVLITTQPMVLVLAHDVLCDECRADNLADWNDRPERTHDEVMAVLDAAIAKARAGD